MMKTTKNLALCILTVVMLLLQLVNPATVRADGETPPASSTEVVSATPDPVETAATDPAQQDPSLVTPVETGTLEPATETPVETSTPVPSSVSTLEPTADTAQATLNSDVTESIPTQENVPETDLNDQTSLFESAQTIPADTNVVVLDQNGQPLSLASQQAAQVIATSDPVWCPAGQAPTPGANGCTTSYATLSDLVANEGGNIAADGTIWITSGPVPEVSQVTINGSTYSTWSDYGLTLQGGWSGVSGDQTIGSNSVFSVPLQIVNWNNSVVINNVSIENVVTSGTDWLNVQTNSGDITISDSNISNNFDDSNIAAGVRLYTPGNLTINNSNFDSNVGANEMFSANLTINNSNFTNTDDAIAGVDYFTLVDCSPGSMTNVFISNSNFNNNNTVGFTARPLSSLCINNDGLYHVNVTIDNSSFNNNMGSGFEVFYGNVTINSSAFNNNAVGGVGIAGNGTINNSSISGNDTGIVFNGDLTLNDVILANNDLGVASPCLPNAQLTLNDVIFLGNGSDMGNLFNCTGTPFKVITNGSTISYQNEGEFALDCASVDGYSVNLLNGDRVQLFCPVSGTADISSLDSTALPAPLPADYSYASAFSLAILQNETPISVITEGGYLKSSFATSSPQAGDTYSILYWDSGTWVPLKEFTLEENGSLKLNPNASEDPREILSGVKLVTDNGSPRVEVSTNFPGIFVLAQH